MILNKAASRFAKSFLDLSKERNLLEDSFADMSLVLTICEENKEFRILLKSPVIRTDKKLAVFKLIFKDKISPLSYLFIELITKKKRENILEDIAKSFVSKYKSEKDVLLADLVTPIPATKELKAKIREVLEKLNHHSIEISEHVKPELIGGFLLKVGDQQIDASVQTQLNELKKELTQNLYIAKI